MKTLNRPMFRYGGPIKEGIMDGMQDGGLANNEGPRRAALVGNPVYPKGPDGRTGHFIPAVIGGVMSAARALPMVYRGFRSVRTLPGKGFVDKAKQFFTPSNPGFRQTTPTITRSKTPTVKADGDYSAINITPGKPLSVLQALKDPTRVGQFIRQNPLTALTIPTLPNVALGALKAAGPVALEGGKRYIDAILPGEQFRGGDEEDLKTTDGTGIKRGNEKNINVGSTDTGGTGDSKSDAEKKQINEARIEENKQKYYKLMGIDKMNKEATYDSLIDASKIIAEKGGDLKGAIKSGDLQSSLISAISKNLDKSTDLKKQIDAAVLKAEIQKDINLTKPSAFAEQVAYLKNNPNDPLARKLSGLTSVADNLAALADKPITSDIVSRLVQSKGTDVAGIIKDDKFQKWEKNNENKDEIDYLQDVYKGQQLEEGIYIINKKAISIDKDGNAFPVDLDSIIG